MNWRIPVAISLALVVSGKSYAAVPAQALPIQSSAEIILPLPSMRHQSAYDCWAYGPAHMLEARLYAREGRKLFLDIEKSARYWQIYDRLVHAHRKRHAFKNVLELGDYSLELLNILETHGLDEFTPESGNGIDYVSLFSSSSFLDFLALPNTWNLQVGSDILKLPKLEDYLAATTLSDAEADSLIRQSLDRVIKTSWQGHFGVNGKPGTIHLKDIVAADLDPSADPLKSFVNMGRSQLKKYPEYDHRWFRYEDQRFPGYGESDQGRLLELIRLSLRNRWPVTIESSRHSMTCLGYRTAKGLAGFEYAIIDTDGTEFLPAGFSWQSEDALKSVLYDITVFAPAIGLTIPSETR